MNSHSAIDLWLVDIEAAAPSLAALDASLGLLSDEDRERAERLSSAAHRIERLACYTALRVALEHRIGALARRQQFARMPGGRPVLQGDDCSFSLSHSQQHALIGVGHRAASIGVDLEHARTIRLDLRRRGLIEKAAAGLLAAPLPEAGTQRRFLQSWTRLEALAKARGDGIGILLSRIGVLGGEKPEAAPEALTGGYSVMDIDMPAGDDDATAALAAHGNLPAAPPVVRRMPVTLDGLRALLDPSAGR